MWAAIQYILSFLSTFISTFFPTKMSPNIPNIPNQQMLFGTYNGISINVPYLFENDDDRMDYLCLLQNEVKDNLSSKIREGIPIRGIKLYTLHWLKRFTDIYKSEIAKEPTGNVGTANLTKICRLIATEFNLKHSEDDIVQDIHTHFHLTLVEALVLKLITKEELNGFHNQDMKEWYYPKNT